MTNPDDSSFLHNFTILILALTVVGISVFVLASFVAELAESSQPTDKSISLRLQPEGKLNITSQEMSIKSIDGVRLGKFMDQDTQVTAANQESNQIETNTEVIKTGEQIYNEACSICHNAGVGNAPKYGDQLAWEGRITKGLATLYDNAINGYVGQAGVMPAKGGRPDLSEEAVKTAVDYLAESIGN